MYILQYQTYQIKKLHFWTLYEKGGMNAEKIVEFIDENIKGKYKKHLIIMDKWVIIKAKGERYCREVKE